MQVIDYCRKMGLDMIQGDHEDSPGQLELNFTFDDALRTADRLATYRQICAQVARVRHHRLLHVQAVHGRFAPMAATTTFRCGGRQGRAKALGNDPKKLPGMAQNYMYSKGGDNTFMPDTDDVQLPGKIGLTRSAASSSISAR